MRQTSLLLLGLLLLFSLQTVAMACECAMADTRVSVVTARERAEVVIVGTIVEVTNPDPAGHFSESQNISVRVDKVYKGAVVVDQILPFGQGQAKDCKWHFTKSLLEKKFLFYLDKRTKRPFRSLKPAVDVSDGTGKYYVSTCGISKAIENATEDLASLEN